VSEKTLKNTKQAYILPVENLAAKMDMDRVYSYKIVCCYLDPQAAKMSCFQDIITMGN
jgi:hypothetical protein